MTLFVSLSDNEEIRKCVRCGANLRYELLAQTVRSRHPGLANLDVLELDPNSPLRGLLECARTHVRTYFDPLTPPGTERNDGAQCEDITQLTFESDAFDLVVSSEVLEHVVDLDAALTEAARVLRRGGAHVFTVPYRERTRQRARVTDEGVVEHLTKPEYHSDPLSPNGILTFWDIGVEDAAPRFARAGLRLEFVGQPIGRDRRLVWWAERV